MRLSQLICYCARCCVLALLLVIVACAGPSRIVVEERPTVDPRVAAEKIGGTRIRIVQPGDTLYGIAFANGLNVYELARWNQLADTSRLQVGQRIRLSPPYGDDAETTPAPPTSTSSGTSAKPKPASGSKHTADKSSPASPRVRTLFRWQWPAEGRVIGTFSPSKGRQGIDITGQLGQPVWSAGDGEVVYVGNGLKGYGNLVIVKHNEQFLSAYAHNQEIFVIEGQRVSAGMRIASMGEDRQQRSALHFQIRRDGDPVDPLRQLPKR